METKYKKALAIGIPILIFIIIVVVIIILILSSSSSPSPSQPPLPPSPPSPPQPPSPPSSPSQPQLQSQPPSSPLTGNQSGQKFPNCPDYIKLPNVSVSGYVIRDAKGDNLAIPLSSYDECANYCTSIPGCDMFSYTADGKCYPKSGAPSAIMTTAVQTQDNNCSDYTYIYNSEFMLGDGISWTTENSMQDCENLCNNTESCRGYNYCRNGMCDNQRGNCRIFKTGESDSTMGVKYVKIPNDINNQCNPYYTNNYAGIIGFDLPNTNKTTDTYQECLDYCDSIDGCNYVQYNTSDKTCYPKSFVNADDSTLLIKPDNNCGKFAIYDSKNIPNNNDQRVDLYSLSNSNVEQCQTTCMRDNSCRMANYKPSTQTCYIKTLPYDINSKIGFKNNN